MAADGNIAAVSPHAVGDDKVNSLQRFARRRSTIAFVMTLPLLVVVVGLVAYPGGLSACTCRLLNRRMTAFAGFLNFEILLQSETFWMVVWQSCIFAITAVLLKALIGFWLAHMLHHIPTKGQRKWRGMLLVPVGDPAGALHARLVVDVRSFLFLAELDPGRLRRPDDPVAGRAVVGARLRHHRQRVVRRAVLHDHVPGGAEVGARAAVRSGGDRRRHRHGSGCATSRCR